MTSKTNSYVRYADDFIFLCVHQDVANEYIERSSNYLQNRLALRLNEPIITDTKTGIEFLGVTLQKGRVSVSAKKQQTLIERINTVEISRGVIPTKSIDQLEGIKNYYGKILPAEFLIPMDVALTQRISYLIETGSSDIPNKTILAASLYKLPFFTMEADLRRKNQIEEWQRLYLSTKKATSALPPTNTKEKNKLLINKKKKEYQKRESEGTELIVSTFGTFIGKNHKGITVKQYGKPIHNSPSIALSHITVTTRGVSVSSDAISYCMANNIPIDFFDNKGKHYASILSPISVKQSVWQKQSNLSSEQKIYLSTQLILGKLKNQLNLIKYYNKYHKDDLGLTERYEYVYTKIMKIQDKIKNTNFITENYAEELMAFEAQGATAYWSYIRHLLEDDDIGFETRIRKGATDIFNSLLNYGYAILYARVWQAILFAKLNPSIGFLHVDQQGKPTLAYDLIELFRAQAVDRVVIGLIQTGQPLTLDKGLLSESTKKLLIKNILERLYRYEKYRAKELKFTQIVKEQARDIAAYVKDEKKIFRPYIAKW